jgi:ATP-binding cassette subfamily B protein
MIKLAKYLKPFILNLAVVIALLFGQATCELNLPNFMSDIVNVGIQQNGIEHSAPDAISPDGMALMTTFMTDSEKQLVEEHYTLVSGSDKNAGGETYVSLYPKAGDELYIKTAGDEAASSELDTLFGTATWTMVITLQELAKQSGMDFGGGSSMELGDIDLAQLYALQPMFAAVPESVIQGAQEQAVQSDGTILTQSGILMAKAFYTELGVDIGRAQSGYILRIGSLMLGIALLGGIATVLVSLLSSRIAAGTCPQPAQGRLQ